MSCDPKPQPSQGDGGDIFVAWCCFMPIRVSLAEATKPSRVGWSCPALGVFDLEFLFQGHFREGAGKAFRSMDRMIIWSILKHTPGGCL